MCMLEYKLKIYNLYPEINVFSEISHRLEENSLYINECKFHLLSLVLWG